MLNVNVESRLSFSQLKKAHPIFWSHDDNEKYLVNFICKFDDYPERYNLLEKRLIRCDDIYIGKFISDGKKVRYYSLNGLQFIDIIKV